MENIFLMSKNFQFNIEVLKNKKWSILIPLLLTYLQYKGYVKLVKSQSKNVEELCNGLNLIACKDLEKLKYDFEHNFSEYGLSHVELEDLKNGISLYAIIVSMPEADPLYTTVCQAVSYINEIINFKETDNLYTIFDFYEYLCTINIVNDIKRCIKYIFNSYSDDIATTLNYANLDAVECEEVTKLMLHLLNAKDGCIVHPYAGLANIMSKLKSNTYYSVAYPNPEHTLVYNIYADILGATAKCKKGNFPLELTDFTAEYVLVDNIGIETESLWKIMISTAVNNATGVFITDNVCLYNFKTDITRMYADSLATYMTSEKISHIIFLRNSTAIILLQKEKKNKGIVTLVNETGITEINAQNIIDDIKHQNNCYEMSIEEFNKEDFLFDLNRIVRKNILKEMSENNNFVKLKQLLLPRIELNIDIYKLHQNKSIKETNDIFVRDFSKYLPYYAFENKKLITVPVHEVNQYKDKLLLVDVSGRRYFQPKVIVFNDLDNIRFPFGKIYPYRINEELVDIRYLAKELNESYFINQIFPTQIRSILPRWEDILECYIKIPKTGSRTPLEEQRILYNDDKLVFLQHLLSDYSYNVEEFATANKENKLKPGTVLNGRYKIIKKLGSGGFGKTYEAEDISIDTKKTKNKVVAIKEFFCEKYQFRAEDGKRVLTPIVDKIGEVTSSRIKFMNEANKIKTFKSDNIIKVYDVFNENETCYYAMEYIKGSNLAEYSARKVSIEEKEAVRIIKCIALALKEIHKEKMLHLDIKPENVMITNDGRVVLIDFGAAHKYNISSKDNTTFVEYNSHGFTAPGMISDTLFKACRDIYSLGATLYYMLSNKVERKKMVVPVNNKIKGHLGEASIIGAIANEYEMVRPSNISDTAWNCIIRCTNKTFFTQIKSIDEFLEMLPS